MYKIRNLLVRGYAIQLTLVVGLFFSASSPAEVLPGDHATGILISREAVEVPGYDALADRPLIKSYTNESYYNDARHDDRYIFEKLVYLSDGLNVVTLTPRISFGRTGERTRRRSWDDVPQWHGRTRSIRPCSSCTAATTRACRSANRCHSPRADSTATPETGVLPGIKGSAGNGSSVGRLRAWRQRKSLL